MADGVGDDAVQDVGPSMEAVVGRPSARVGVGEEQMAMVFLLGPDRSVWFANGFAASVLHAEPVDLVGRDWESVCEEGGLAVIAHGVRGADGLGMGVSHAIAVSSDGRRFRMTTYRDADRGYGACAVCVGVEVPTADEPSASRAA